MESASKEETTKKAKDKAEEEAKETTETTEPVASDANPEKKKKKHKKHKKKAQKKEGEPEAKENEKAKEESKVTEEEKSLGEKLSFGRALDNSVFRKLANWKEGEYKQTTPPTIPIDEQYPDHKYPVGVICQYEGPNSHRMSKPENAMKEKLFEGEYNDLRRAAECHRQVRRYAQTFIRPGVSYLEIASRIENAVRKLIKINKLEAGLAFPCGTSINNCAAHFAPNLGDTKILDQNDVVKIDFGTHVRGFLIDSAFTVAFNPVYDPLLEASKEATMTGVKAAGIDARLDEIGELIQETMEAHEVEIKGRMYKVRCIQNLNGHQVARYRVHGGKTVPIVKGGPQIKMEEGEIYAIETFGSTGKGYVMETEDTSHYMKTFNAKPVAIRNSRSKALLRLIEDNYGTLAFARRWLDELGFEKHFSALKPLVDCGAVTAYPPLSDIVGSYVSQFEHTFILRPTCKEILSIGDDF